MSKFIRPLAAAVFGTVVVSSHATAVPLVADGQWQSFNVNELDALSFRVEWIDNANSLSPGFGSPLSFTFTIAAGAVGAQTTVDAGFACDTLRSRISAARSARLQRCRRRPTKPPLMPAPISTRRSPTPALVSRRALSEPFVDQHAKSGRLAA